MATDPVSAFLQGFAAVDQVITNKQTRERNTQLMSFADKRMSHEEKVWQRDDDEYKRLQLDRIQKDFSTQWRNGYATLQSKLIDELDKAKDAGDIEGQKRVLGRLENDDWLANQVISGIQSANPGMSDHIANSFGLTGKLAPRANTDVKELGGVFPNFAEGTVSFGVNMKGPPRQEQLTNNRSSDPDDTAVTVGFTMGHARNLMGQYADQDPVMQAIMFRLAGRNQAAGATTTQTQTQTQTQTPPPPPVTDANATTSPPVTGDQAPDNSAQIESLINELKGLEVRGAVVRGGDTHLPTFSDPDRAEAIKAELGALGGEGTEVSAALEVGELVAGEPLQEATGEEPWYDSTVQWIVDNPLDTALLAINGLLLVAGPAGWIFRGGITALKLAPSALRFIAKQAPKLSKSLVTKRNPAASLTKGKGFSVRPSGATTITREGSKVVTKTTKIAERVAAPGRAGMTGMTIHGAANVIEGLTQDQVSDPDTPAVPASNINQINSATPSGVSAKDYGPKTATDQGAANRASAGAPVPNTDQEVTQVVSALQKRTNRAFNNADRFNAFMLSRAGIPIDNVMNYLDTGNWTKGGADKFSFSLGSSNIGWIGNKSNGTFRIVNLNGAGTAGVLTLKDQKLLQDIQANALKEVDTALDDVFGPADEDNRQIRVGAKQDILRAQDQLKVDVLGDPLKRLDALMGVKYAYRYNKDHKGFMSWLSNNRPQDFNTAIPGMLATALGETGFDGFTRTLENYWDEVSGFTNNDAQTADFIEQSFAAVNEDINADSSLTMEDRPRLLREKILGAIAEAKQRTPSPNATRQ